MDRNGTLPALMAAADAAYQLVRTDVIDKLPPRTAVNIAMLTGHQRRAINSMNHAEEALADFRAKAHAVA